MNILCAIGLHKWKPRYRIVKERMVELNHLLWPSLFVGPPFLIGHRNLCSIEAQVHLRSMHSL